MNYTTTEARDGNGHLVITFHFSNGKTVTLNASGFASGAKMIEAAKAEASQ